MRTETSVVVAQQKLETNSKTLALWSQDQDQDFCKMNSSHETFVLTETRKKTETKNGKGGDTESGPVSAWYVMNEMPLLSAACSVHATVRSETQSLIYAYTKPLLICKYK